MKTGELYKVCHKWLLPRSTSEFWSNCGTILYVGEDITLQDNGKVIKNHAVLVDGQRRLLDQTFLKFLEPINANR